MIAIKKDNVDIHMYLNRNDFKLIHERDNELIYRKDNFNIFITRLNCNNLAGLKSQYEYSFCTTKTKKTALNSFLIDINSKLRKGKFKRRMIKIDNIYKPYRKLFKISNTPLQAIETKINNKLNNK